ncbi:DUF6731 family protein [Clostridium perfringens]|uniref:DUF6731 family protein n=4 Tax=Clostridium perfringens TaxID=1502 RepID=UPI0018E437EB|nr:DUF6731 family protein [Clostridium perfringens]EGS5729567.1 hypothetical protein [Clostridium perfringens]ELC8330375.1 hypothetical protein [Clostridium perfringens]MBI6052767.1 hypothetical protein [Clostridium perfringens]MDB2051297.1 hypothetical protein [Clostridium perfringens]MDK0657942.1 hypothetical protein [Clostridium perfringens]
MEKENNSSKNNKKKSAKSNKNNKSGNNVKNNSNSKNKKNKKNKKKNKIKEFTVEFLQLLEEKDLPKNKVQKTPINLSDNLESMLKLPITQRDVDYHDDKIRLQSLKKFNPNKLPNKLKGKENLWELQFIKIKDSLVEGLLEDNTYKEDGLASFLGSNKKLVDSCVVLYDAQNCVFIIEKNINLPVSAILEFFSKFLKNTDLTFGIIPDKTKLNTVSSSEYIKSFELTLVNINDDNFKSKFLKKKNFGAIFSAIKSLRSFNNDRLYIKISINGNKKDCMSSNELKKCIPNLMGNAVYVNKLVVGLKENEDSQVEKINLYDSRLKDTQKISYSKNEYKKLSSISLLLQQSYNKKKEIIDSLEL